MSVAPLAFALSPGALRQEQPPWGCRVHRRLMEILLLPPGAEEKRVPQQFSCLSAAKFSNQQTGPHYPPSKGKR